MAINNPYVPGDPYSYDLKWMVDKIKTLLRRAKLKIEPIDPGLIDWDNSTISEGSALVYGYRIGNDIYFTIDNFEVDISNNMIMLAEPYHFNFRSVEYFPLLTTSPGGYWLDTVVGYYQIGNDRITFTQDNATPVTCSFSGHITMLEEV